MMSKKYRTAITRRKFEMPHICCVCGKPVETVLQYAQEEMPLAGPGMIPLQIRVYVESRKISMPYCAEHAKRFQKRGRMYHLLQAFFFVGGFALLMGKPHSETTLRAYHLPTSAGTYEIMGMVSMGLAVAMLLGKGIILYDACIRTVNGGLEIEAPSAEFIAGVERALIAASDTSRAEGAQPVDEKTREAKRKTNLRRARERLRRKD